MILYQIEYYVGINYNDKIQEFRFIEKYKQNFEGVYINKIICEYT